MPGHMTKKKKKKKKKNSFCSGFSSWNLYYLNIAYYKHYLLKMSTIIKTFSSWAENKDNQQFQSLSSILTIQQQFSHL